VLLRCGFGVQFDVPGQQFFDAVHRVVRDALQDFAQIGLRIQAVEFG